jgi:hypothetical protein
VLLLLGRGGDVCFGSFGTEEKGLGQRENIWQEP